MIHVAEDRTLEPIVDPWVEEFESDHGRSRPPPPGRPGRLYMDRAPEPQPAAEPAYDDYDDRDHRKSRLEPVRQEAARSDRLRRRRRPRRAPSPDAPDRPSLSRAGSPAGDAEDDLEIPSFLRRLAN